MFANIADLLSFWGVIFYKKSSWWNFMFLLVISWNFLILLEEGLGAEALGVRGFRG